MKYEYWFIEYEGGACECQWLSYLDWALFDFIKMPIASAVKLREVEQ